MANKYIKISEGAFKQLLSEVKKAQSKADSAHDLAASANSTALGNSTRITTMNGTISSLQTDLNTAKNKLNKYPDFTDAILKDNITWAFKNGKFEKVAEAGQDVLTADSATAASLALDALNTGVLQIDENTPPEMVEEVRELLGDELFNRFTEASARTMELAPEMSDKEKVEKAKADYYARLEAEMEAVKQIEGHKLLGSDAKNLDVEQSKSE